MPIVKSPVVYAFGQYTFLANWYIYILFILVLRAFAAELGSCCAEQSTVVSKVLKMIKNNMFFIICTI